MTEPNPIALERRLTLRDLVLFNLVAVIGLPWVATAAKAGPGTLGLWLLAAALFFVPQGLAVIELSSAFPDEGGIYAWTKRYFGEGHGFVCGWCYWINNVLYYPTLLLAAAVMAPFIAGLGESGLGDNWTFVLPFTVVGLVVAVLLNLVGVGTGKWLQNLGGVGVLLPGLLLVVLGLIQLGRGPANPISLADLKPDLTDLPMLNLWATIAFAFAGLELSSTMGSEVEKPRQNLPRSVYISAPLVAFIYLVGTCAMLWLVRKDQINLVAGPLQAISNGLAGAGTAGWWIVSMVALLLTVARLGALGAWLTGSARVAFVVGVDRYFPPSFGRIHPKWRTPYVAILVQAGIAMFFLFVSVIGKGTTVEKAFLILIDMSLLIYFIPYLYLFLCFTAHAWRRPGKFFRVAAALSGLMLTLFAMVVAVIPPPDTVNVWLHETKLLGGALLLLATGVVIYRRAATRSSSLPTA
ncbi:MAG: APC family permease [Chthoniobacterales bacterium]